MSTWYRHWLKTLLSMHFLAAEFKNGRVSINDPRSCRPKTYTTDDQVGASYRMVFDDTRLTVQQTDVHRH